MKIVIVGAGISGCATYLWLKKVLPRPSSANPHTIIIYETHHVGQDVVASNRYQGPTHSSTLLVGGALGVAPNGLSVLGRLDEEILRDVVGGGHVVPTMKMKSKYGQLLMRLQPSGGLLSSDGEPRMMHMLATSRHSLWKCLRARIPDQDIVTKQVGRILPNPGSRCVVTFLDGSPAMEADLVIGADGLKSSTRRAVFPESADDPFPPKYEGLVGVGGFISATDVRELVEAGSMNFLFGGNGFFGYFFSDTAASSPHRQSPYHLSEPGESLAWWSTYAVDQCPSPSTMDLHDVLRQLRHRHQDWTDPVVQTILQHLRVDNMYPTWTVPPLPTWERDGVILVGDAAHALPPTSGQGSSQALEDAEALALLLSHHLQKANTEDGDASTRQRHAVRLAAKQYVDLRFPRVTKILRNAQSSQDSKRQKGTVEEYRKRGLSRST